MLSFNGRIISNQSTSNSLCVFLKFILRSGLFMNGILSFIYTPHPPFFDSPANPSYFSYRERIPGVKLAFFFICHVSVCAITSNWCSQLSNNISIWSKFS